jgi:glycosyltransferase involved in cell wall biosynthesis
LAAECRVLELVYGLPQSRIEIVPLGLSQIFLKAGQGSRDADFLICAGTITRQKNSVALARMAHQAQTPILFVGKPYFKSDPYWKEFLALVDGQWVRHQPHLDDPAAMAALLKSARGAVHMSDFENWCFTAHEAAACGLPVLLPDQNWSRERFGDQAHYFDRIGVSLHNVELLKQFYAAAPNLPSPAIQLFSWTEIATRLKNIYERLLNPS